MISPSALGGDSQLISRRLNGMKWRIYYGNPWALKKSWLHPVFFSVFFGWVPHRIPRDVPRYLSLLCGFMLFVDCRDCQLPSRATVQSFTLGNFTLPSTASRWGLLHRALLQASPWASQIPTNENCLSGWSLSRWMLLRTRLSVVPAGSVFAISCCLQDSESSSSESDGIV